MKKIICLTGIVVLSGILFSCKQKEEKVPAQGIVNFFAGKVSVIESGKERPIKVGDAVKEGMTIVTGVKATAELYFEGSVVKVLENTSIEIKQLFADNQTNAETSEFYVQKGKIFSSVTKKLVKDSSYKIKTPTTIAAIRGTDFMVSEEKGKANVACTEGKVEVRDATVKESDVVQLEAGQEVEVKAGEPLSVRDLSEMNKRNIENIKKEIREMRKEIRREFEEQRKLIREAVKKQKVMNKEMVENQKAMDKQNIENVKKETKEIMNSIKGDVDEQKAESKKALSEVKPDVKKFSSDVQKPKVDGLKPNIKNFKQNVEKPSVQ